MSDYEYGQEDPEGALFGGVKKGVLARQLYEDDKKQPGQMQGVKASDLDKPDAVDLHGRLLSLIINEMEVQGENRQRMAEDEGVYDGGDKQWTPKDLAILAKRNVKPLTYNVTATAINWMLGTEKRGRTDYKLVGRRKDGLKSAQRKTELMKYISDVNRTPFSVSKAFAETVKAGLGFMECGVQDDAEGEPILERFESWRNMIWDSNSTEDDMSDARFIARLKWMDTDTAKKMFSNRKTVIEMASNKTFDQSFFDVIDIDDPVDAQERFNTDGAGGGHGFLTKQHTRQRVRMIEVYFKQPVEEERIRGGQFAGEVFDPHSHGHMDALNSGESTLIKKVMMRVYVAIMTNAGLVHLSKSPYRHNKYPFTPIWAFRDSDTGLPYGVIRNIKPIQEDLNRRATKALQILSNNKIIVDSDALGDNGDWNEFAQEAARHDAILRVKPGSRLVLDAERGMDQAHMQMMHEDASMIQSISGVTSENTGQAAAGRSGKAIIALQEQGSLATAGVFDNLRLARQVHGEKVLSLIEQFMKEEKSFYITNTRGAPEYRSINDGMPENDVTRTKADFIISEDAADATIRQSQSQEFMDLLKELAPVAPQIVLQLLDLMVEMMDTPQRDEIVKRIREVTGMKDPDADPSDLSPEEQQAEANKKQQEAIMAEMSQRAAAAQLAKTEADADKAAAEVAKIQAETTARSAAAKKAILDAQAVAEAMPSKDMDNLSQALDVAERMLANPDAATVADRLIETSEATSQAQPTPVN